MKRNKIKPAVTFNILRNEIKVLSWKSLKSTVRVYKQGLERSFPGIVSLFKLNCLSGPARAGHGGTLRGAEFRRGRLRRASGSPHPSPALQHRPVRRLRGAWRRNCQGSRCSLPWAANGSCSNSHRQRAVSPPLWRSLEE